MSIFLRLKDFGWCLGKLVDRVPNRTRKIGGVQVNFIAEFDIDEGTRTDLALELHERVRHLAERRLRVVDAT